MLTSFDVQAVRGRVRVKCMAAYSSLDGSVLTDQDPLVLYAFDEGGGMYAKDSPELKAVADTPPRLELPGAVDDGLHPVLGLRTRALAQADAIAEADIWVAQEAERIREWLGDNPAPEPAGD